MEVLLFWNYLIFDKYPNPPKVADGLRIRTKLATQSTLMLLNAEIIGIMGKGAKVKNQATAQVGDTVWMYIGLDKKVREQCARADIGDKTYIK